MRLSFLAAGIAVALFMAPEASAQIGGVQGISSAQGKAAGRTSQLQINTVFDPVSVAPANFPGSSNITEAQFKAAVAEAVTNLQTALYVNAVTYIEVYWVAGGSTFFTGCTLATTADAESCLHFNSFTWAPYLAAFNTNAITANARSAYNNLPVSNPIPGGNNIFITLSNQIALGLATTGGSGTPDCGIALNNLKLWTPTQNGGAGPIAPSTLDLVGSIMHELRECMGGFREAGTVGGAYFSMDAMAYSAPGTLNFTTTGTAYFSVDGGITNINTFNQSTGDKGDWSGLTPDSFNANTTSGQIQPLSAGDIKNLDALGYQCGSC